MKKFIIPVALCAMLMSGPAMAFMTLKSCKMVNTMNGVRWLGVYCDTQGTCVQQMFADYCPYML